MKRFKKNEIKGEPRGVLNGEAPPLFTGIDEGEMESGVNKVGVSSPGCFYGTDALDLVKVSGWTP